MANMKDTHRMRIYPPTPEHVAITKSVQEVEDMFTQDIRETLYADGGIVNVVEKLNESLPPLPTVIDLSDAKEDYVIEEGKNSIVVLINNDDENAKCIVLPAAIVGLRVTIINQDDASVDIKTAGNDYINGSYPGLKLTTLTSATFYCYDDGKWAII